MAFSPDLRLLQLVSQKLLTRGYYQLQSMEELLSGVHGAGFSTVLEDTGNATLGYYGCNTDMLRAWEAGGIAVDILKVLIGRQGRQNLFERARGGWQGHKEMAVGRDYSLCHQLSPNLLLADINECEEVGSPEPLCRGGTCENTEGSYHCQCLPGYVALARSHHCVPQTAQSPAAA